MLETLGCRMKGSVNDAELCEQETNLISEIGNPRGLGAGSETKKYGSIAPWQGGGFHSSLGVRLQARASNFGARTCKHFPTTKSTCRPMNGER